MSSLQAMLLLYAQGFPIIGQIHCGNVFLREGRYVLGGYENFLLGYRASIYSDISGAGLMESMDVVMFGKSKQNYS